MSNRQLNFSSKYLWIFILLHSIKYMFTEQCSVNYWWKSYANEIKDRFFKLNLTYICIMYIVHTNLGQEWFNMDYCICIFFLYRSIKSSFKKWDALSHFFFFSTHLHAEKPFFYHITIIFVSLQMLIHSINCVKNL